MNDITIKKDVIEVETGDRQTVRRPKKFPIVVVLDKLRSAFNVGNIFRLAEITQIEKVITSHYTATPPHPKLKKSARGTDELVPFAHFDTAESAILSLKKDGYMIYGVETVTDAELYWECKLKFPCAFVVGNEALGISQEALNLCDAFIKLPCYGTKNSLNVGNCVAVVLYEAIRQCQGNE